MSELWREIERELNRGCPYFRSPQQEVPEVLSRKDKYLLERALEQGEQG